MNAPVSKFPQNRDWRDLYTTAILEPDTSKLPDRIAEAEEVIAQRTRELFQETGDTIEEEQALDDPCMR